MSARLLVLAKFLQVLLCSDFRYNSLPFSVSIICILKTKLTLETMFPVWETGKHVRAMNVSGKMLPSFVDVY